MKYKKIIALDIAVLLLTLSACSDRVMPEIYLILPAADAVSEENITVQETPIFHTERPEFCPKDRVREKELISLHGYRDRSVIL